MDEVVDSFHQLSLFLLWAHFIIHGHPIDFLLWKRRSCSIEDWALGGPIFCIYNKLQLLFKTYACMTTWVMQFMSLDTFRIKIRGIKLLKRRALVLFYVKKVSYAFSPLVGPMPHGTCCNIVDAWLFFFLVKSTCHVIPSTPIASDMFYTHDEQSSMLFFFLSTWLAMW